MATSRPFAYNPGGSLSGTTQVGDISVGTPTIGFESTGLEWWNGPDEDLGYVIALPAPLDNQDTPVPGNELYLDPAHKATDISLSNSDQTATQVFSYQQSVLALTRVSAESIMFSVKFTSTNPSVGVGSRLIGVGRLDMNYSGTFDGYPGNDNKSLGISDAGKIYFNGSIVSTVATWGDGDIIDIAVSGSMMWIRINGGNWNNSPTADPTGAEGINIDFDEFYPVLCPSIYGTMTILNVPKYGCPSGLHFLGHTTASVGFIRTNGKSDPLFIELVNSKFDKSYTTIGECLSYLNGSGYWNSYPV